MVTFIFSVAWITMNIDMNIFLLIQYLIQWAGETQLSIQSIMTLRSWMKNVSRENWRIV